MKAEVRENNFLFKIALFDFTVFCLHKLMIFLKADLEV